MNSKMIEEQIRHKELDAYIAERITTAMNYWGLTKSDLGKKLAELTGLLKTTIMNDLTCVLDGYLEHWLGISRKYTHHSATARKFRTLGLMLYELSIEKDDVLITRLKETYQNFVYPPSFES